MLPKLKMCYRSMLVIYLLIVTIFSAPLQLEPVFVAQPQIMMHTLQQPIPLETLQSLKTQNVQRKPVRNEDTTSYQTRFPNIKEQYTSMMPTHPLNLEHLQSTQVEEQEQSPLAPMLYQQMINEEQQMALQHQMLALQQLQAMQQMNPIHSPVPWSMPQPQPLLILLPNESTEANGNNKLFKNYDKNKENGPDHDTTYLNEDVDSVITEGSDHAEKTKTRRAILLIPNARFSIGGLISIIPWLPIEINVPDTVTWAWNGISSGIASIISIIGSRLPFRPQPQVQVPIVQVPPETTDDPGVKMFLKQLQMKNYQPVTPVMPMFVMPMDGVIPVQF